MPADVPESQLNTSYSCRHSGSAVGLPASAGVRQACLSSWSFSSYFDNRRKTLPVPETTLTLLFRCQQPAKHLTCATSLSVLTISRFLLKASMHFTICVMSCIKQPFKHAANAFVELGPCLVALQHFPVAYHDLVGPDVDRCKSTNNNSLTPNWILDACLGSRLPTSSPAAKPPALRSLSSWTP